MADIPTLSFSQILDCIKHEHWPNVTEKLHMIQFESEAHKQSILKKLHWMIFQYERDIFLNQEMIEFIKFGKKTQVKELIKCLFLIGVNPFKKSWRHIIDAYQGPPPLQVSKPDIGSMIAKNFFKVIKPINAPINEISNINEINADIQICRTKVSNLFEITKWAAKEVKTKFKVDKIPIVSPNIVPLVQNVQGTKIKKAIDPPVITRKPIEESINKLKIYNIPKPKFRTDVPISISNKLVLSKSFSHGKGILDPPDIMILENEIDTTIEKELLYKKAEINNKIYYVSKQIENFSTFSSSIESFYFGIDISLVDKKLKIPYTWKTVSQFKYGFFVTAPEIKWNSCLSKIRRSRRNFIEQALKEVKI